MAGIGKDLRNGILLVLVLVSGLPERFENENEDEEDFIRTHAVQTA